MFRKLYNRLEAWDSQLRRSFGKDLETPSGRFWARVHYHAFDHAFLRVFWTNYKEIAPGVFRSNQPTEARFKRYHKRGLKSVLNLRGKDEFSFYLYEENICKALGMSLTSYKLNARCAPRIQDIINIIDLLGTLEKPFLFHCKSGADRAGLVSALYAMHFLGQSPKDALKQLTFRHVHLDFTATGVLDYFMWAYEARIEESDISFLDWVKTEYDPETLQSCFNARKPVDEALVLMKTKVQECAKT